MMTNKPSKKFCIIVVTLICTLLMVSADCEVAWGHPGRTDSNGGHYDRSTDEYHYHHGFEAHQHVDGVCPYDNVDKTDHSGGGSNSSGANGGGNQGVIDNPTTIPQVSKAPQDNTLFYVILSIIALYILYKYTNHLKNQRELIKEREEQQRLELEKKRNQEEQFARDRANWLNMYAGKNLLRMVNPPENVFLANNLPATKGKEKYGKYTVYVARSGVRFHRNPNCGGNKLYPENYCRYYNNTPCKKCVHDIPPIQWYLDYITIIREKKRLKITDEDIQTYIYNRSASDK